MEVEELENKVKILLIILIAVLGVFGVLLLIGLGMCIWLFCQWKRFRSSKSGMKYIGDPSLQEISQNFSKPSGISNDIKKEESQNQII